MPLRNRQGTSVLILQVMLWVVLTHAATGSNSSQDSTVLSRTLRLECCDIRNMLARYIADRGGLRESNCVPSTCKADREVHVFIWHTIAALGLRIQVDEQQEVIVHLDSLSSESVSELLVWAFMGRYVTKHQNGEVDHTHKFLEYNTITQQITVQEPQCSFQETVYQIMICIAIIAIIGIMLLQTVAESEKCQEAEEIRSTPLNKTPNKDVCFRIDNYQDNQKAIRFR